MLDKNYDTKSRYTQVKALGNGSFGNVWLVRSNFSFKTYVKKEMNERCNDGKERGVALNEANILARLKHKNIIRYKDAYFDGGKLCIIMEYADDGDLYTKIRKQNGRTFQPTQILDWFVQLVMAVKYIHDENILHRDLKSQNIFLTMTGILKVGDFGISRLLECTSDHAKTAVGTPYYLSPEICRREPYNQKSDIWSLGVILYEMTMLTYPFTGKTLTDLVGCILVGKYAPVDSTAGPLIRDLILLLLQVNANDRPSATNIIGIPAIAIIMKNFVNNTKELDRHSRKDSLGSPVIERKRDRSFKYDVIFDLTLSNTIKDRCSEERAIKEVFCSDRIDSTENRPAVRQCSPVTWPKACDDVQGKPFRASPTRADHSKMSSIKPSKTIVASDFTSVEELGKNSTIEKRKISDIDRKKTFNLDKDNPPKFRRHSDNDRRSCFQQMQKEKAQDLVEDVSCAKDIYENVSYNKRRCPNSVTADDVNKPRRTVPYVDTQSSCQVETVGPVTDYASFLKDFPAHVGDKEPSTNISKKDTYTLESKQSVQDYLSARCNKIPLKKYSVGGLSPKFKRKVLDRARIHSSQDIQRMKRLDSQEDGKGNGLGDCHKSLSIDKVESIPFKSCLNVDDWGGKRKEKLQKFDGKFGKKTRENSTNDYNVEADVLVLIDDDKFSLMNKNNVDDSMILKRNTRDQDKCLLQRPSKMVERSSKMIEDNYEKMEKLQAMLEDRIGVSKLKVLCDFLRKRKLALLEDDVLSYVHHVLGNETDNLLPPLLELLLLDKRLYQISNAS